MSANRTVALRIAIQNYEETRRQLKSLGAIGEAALNQIESAAPRASRALQGVGDAVDRAATVSNRATSRMAQGFAQLGMQAQDVAVQLGMGTHPLIVFAQQGSQIASILPGWGAGIGAVAAAVGGLAYAFLGVNKEAKDLPPLLDAMGAAFGAQEEFIERFVGVLDKASEAQRKYLLSTVDLQKQIAMGEATGAVGKLGDLMAGELQSREPLQLQQPVVGFGFAAGVAGEANIRQQQLTYAAGIQEDFRAPLLAAIEAGDAKKVQEILDDANLPATQEAQDAAIALIGHAETMAGLKTAAKGEDAVRAEAERLKQGGKSGGGAGGGGGGGAGGGAGFVSEAALIGPPKLHPAVEAQRAEVERRRQQDAAEAERLRKEDEREAERLQNESEREAERLQKEAATRVEKIAGMKREVEEQRRLTVANDNSAEAYRRVEIAIAAENAARALGAGASEQERQQARELTTAKLQEEDARKAVADAIKAEDRARDEANRQTKELIKRNEEIDQGIRDAQTKVAEQNAANIVEPFRNAVTNIQNMLAEGIETGMVEGFGGLEGLLEGFNRIGPMITSQLISGLAVQPLLASINSLQQALSVGMGPGGQGPMAALGAWGRLNPGTVGVMSGALASSFMPALTGRQSPFTGIGGMAGGLGGSLVGNMLMPGIGGPIGGIIGGLGGSFLGGLFGGGGVANDRAGVRYWVDDTPGKAWEDDSSSPENRRVVNAISEELKDVSRLLVRQGVNFGAGFGLSISAGNETGFELDGREYSSEAELTGAAIAKILDRTYAQISQNDPLRTVLRESQAQTAGELGADIDFAKHYKSLIADQSEYKVALEELQTVYADAAFRAKELGLSETELNKARLREEKELRETFEQRFKELIDINTSGFSGALKELKDRFDEATKLAKELGKSEAEVSAARSNAEKELREDFRAQYDALIEVSSGGYTGALRQLRDRFAQAESLGRDLGRPATEVTTARTKAEAELREDFLRQYDQLTNIAGSGGFPQALEELRDRFDDAAKLARELGLSEQKLADTRKKAEKDLYNDMLRQMEDRSEGAANTARGFFEGLLAPLGQATGAFGISQGYVQGDATVEAGLGEFREMLAAARGGDVSAIQGITGLGQSVLQAQRQYGYSGDQTRALFTEINKGLLSVQDTVRQQQERAANAMADRQERTLREQTDRMVEELRKVKDELERLRRDRELLDRAA